MTPVINWPKGDQGSLRAFYGEHKLGPEGQPTAKWEAASLVSIVPPFPLRLSWDPARAVNRVRCHWLVEASLGRVLDAIWRAYGRNLAKVQADRVDLFGGCYEFRRVSGSSSLSTHAWGAGIDLDPERNPRGKKWQPKAGMMPIAVVEAFKAEGWAWGGDFTNPDAMHFEAVSRAPAGMASPVIPQSQPQPAALAASSEPPVTMQDALVVPPFPSIADTVNAEGAHVYGTLAGQMRQYGYREFEAAPASPAPIAVRRTWAPQYAACRQDALSMWVRQWAGNNGITDARAALAWWLRKGYGDPEREVARRFRWFAFEVMGDA